MLYRTSINATTIFEEPVPGSYDILITDVFLGIRTTRFILVYRTPFCLSVSSHRLLKAISDHCTCDTVVVVLDDFNLSDVYWSVSHAPLKCSSVSKDFAEFLGAHDLRLLVLKITRQKSFLDLVFCNVPNVVSNLVVGSPIGNSDHARMKFWLNLLQVCPNFTTRKDFAAADCFTIREYLDSIDWLSSFIFLKSVDDVYEMFIAILHHVIEMHVPVVKVAARPTMLPGHL